MSEKVSSLAEGKSLIRHVLQSGLALTKFSEMLVRQGVEEALAQELCTGNVWNVLPRAKHVTCLRANNSGMGVFFFFN